MTAEASLGSGNLNDVSAEDGFPRWRWWKVLRANDQNITADIELARIAIANLADQSYGEYEKRILKSCFQMLTQCVANQQRFFSNRIFVRQTLFLILQNILLITRKENLPAHWLSIKQRLESVDASEIAEYKKSKSIEEIDQYMKSMSAPPKPAPSKKNPDEKVAPCQERIIREKMKEIKSFLDEKIVAEVWSSIVLQRQTYILGTLTLVCLVGTIIAILHEGSSPAPKVGMIAMTIAGLLGGALSTVFQPTMGSSSLPLVRFAIIRPLVGGVAGLFLFLISGLPDLIKLAYPYAYAVAIAFGFSERAFSNALGSTADEIAMGVSKALGHNKAKPRR